MRRALAKHLTDAVQLQRQANAAARTALSSTTAAAGDAGYTIAERLVRSAGASTSGRSFAATALGRAVRPPSSAHTNAAGKTAVRLHPYPGNLAASSSSTVSVRRYWSLPFPFRRAAADALPAKPPKPKGPFCYESILGSSGYTARLAVINAVYAMQPSIHWGRMFSLLMAEALTRGDPTAWCYRNPVTAAEIMYLEEAGAADAAANAKRHGIVRLLRLWLSNSVRLAVLLALFAPVVLWAPLAFGYNLRRRQWMALLRRTLEIAGPAFIKWGQWAATRHDLFPKDLCSELERLHTSAPAHGERFTREAVAAAFGFSVEDLFSEFDPVPVASGSIGQIHKGALSGTGARLTGMAEGTVVAIKVRHPGVSRAIERDFALMMAAARLTNWVPALAPLRLEESMSQFAAPLREQVDLAREAFHLHAFNYNFRTTKDVSFPIPLYPLASPSVLVESFESGDLISRYTVKGPGAPHNSRLAQMGAHAMLRMMIVDNLIHADLHPGNILVRLEPVGGRWGEAAVKGLRRLVDTVTAATGLDLSLPPDFLVRPRMILLDAGMATHLTPQDQINMVGLFEAFSRLDGGAVGAWTLQFAGEEQRCPDPEAFVAAVKAKFDALKEAQAFVIGDTSNGAEALADVLEDVRQYQVVLPGHIVATVVTTLVLEGWSFALDPKHSTLEEVKRVIKAKRGESKSKWVAAWVASAAEREILEHVPRFEPAPPAASTLWAAWLDSWRESVPSLGKSS